MDGVNLYPVDIFEALESLKEVTQRLHSAGDNRAIFAEVYSTMTKNVALAIKEDSEFFENPAFINWLSTHFVRRYLQTLKMSLNGQLQDCEGWQIAYDYTCVPGKLPIVNALLGVSAHINYDLALSTEAAIKKMGVQGEVSRFRSDYNKINAILEIALPQVLEQLIAEYGCDTTVLLMKSGPWQKWANHFAVTKLFVWREQAWQTVMKLVAVHNEEERKVTLTRLDNYTIRQSKMVLKLQILQSLTTQLMKLNRVCKVDLAKASTLKAITSTL